jgi:endonuclease/exonuclease/phosphatase (EEP) superfamily protein YafD
VGIRRLVAWPLAAACLAWAAVRLLGLERGFPLVPLVAYTPLAAVGAVAVALLAAALRQWAAALVAAMVAIALVAVVAPRAIGGPSGAEGGSGPELRVLTANLQYGGASAEALVALVRRTDADVLSVQELDAEAAAALDAAGLRTLLPERLVRVADGTLGTGLYARAALRPRPGPAGTTNPLSAATMAVPGAPRVELVAVHPAAPAGPERIGGWRRDLRALPAARAAGPVRILAGDFNATLDHAELRRLLETGYEDAAAAVGAGLAATWPAGRRLPPPVTIDHVLADRRCGVRGVEVHSIPRTDHRAVLAELVLPQASSSASSAGSGASSARIP